MVDNRTMESFETNGYVKLHTKNPFRQMYVYLDTPDCLADQLFKKEKVRVKFKHDFLHQSGRFLCVFVTCWKKDVESVECALSQLKRKVLLCGHVTDYQDMCQRISQQAQIQTNCG